MIEPMLPRLNKMVVMAQQDEADSKEVKERKSLFSKMIHRLLDTIE